MIRALIDGRKTMTRRVGSLKVINDDPSRYSFLGIAGGPGVPHFAFRDLQTGGQTLVKCRIAKGDRLYVREHWRSWRWNDELSPAAMPKAWGERPNDYVSYIADNDDRMDGRFRQGMHMPRWASRLTLTVTDVRVERLQEITEADAIAEGLQAQTAPNGHITYQVPGLICGQTAVRGYRLLWDTINGDGAWEKDPWIVVLHFEPALQNIDEAAK
jgi:hypothetical protein